MATSNAIRESVNAKKPGSLEPAKDSSFQRDKTDLGNFLFIETLPGMRILGRVFPFRKSVKIQVLLPNLPLVNITNLKHSLFRN